MCSLCDIGPAPALASIREWYADELVDEMVTDFNDVTKAAQSSTANSWQRRLQNRKGYVRDAVGELADGNLQIRIAVNTGEAVVSLGARTALPNRDELLKLIEK